MPKTLAMSLTETVTLPDMGVELLLRPARLADTYRAMELVDIPVAPTRDGERVTPAGLAYQMAVDDMQVLCQVLTGDGEPLADERTFADELSPDDMAALRIAAEALKKKRNALKSSAASGASSNAPSSSAAGGSTTSATPN